MKAYLRCQACRRTEGPFDSYESWSDAASRLRWFVGEDYVLCGDCAATTISFT